ncbi:MAG: mshD 3 [Ramlibacter sp.]|uniref:GNAT family N-acetyltransferase n=1 Tax=Ramlibacter sp. TaxID=1917967 RepID=UPI002637A144|nr:GNAT family N-acetyltransferase [Ramlibacter sp.]MDB5753324.1 mshD 3 [Ramlibacter sp.]
MSNLASTSVRRCAPGDLGALARLFDAYRQFNGKGLALEAGRDFLERRLATGEASVFVADAENSRVIGFTLLYATYSSVSLGRVFIVNDLYVAAPFRRRGVGSALLQAAADHARHEGAVRLTASTAIENVPTQILNEANGFIRDRSYLVYHMRTNG